MNPDKDVSDVLQECRNTGKWILIAPDGRVWIDDNVMLISAVVLAEIGGYSDDGRWMLT